MSVHQPKRECNLKDVLKSAADGLSASRKSTEADAVFRIDVDGIVREWNDAMEQLTGHLRARVLGKAASALQCPGCTIPTCPFAPQDLAALAQRPGKTMETCLRHANGDILPVLKTTRPLLTPSEELAGAEVRLERTV